MAPVNASDPSGLLGEGCGTWWEGARDFGHCGGGRSGGPDGCDMTRLGCFGIGGSGPALISCVTNPMSSYFGAVGFCATNTGDDDGKPVGGKKKSKEPECFAQLKYRPVDHPVAAAFRGQHSFWWVQSETGAQYIISGGTETDSTGLNRLSIWTTPQSQDKANTISSATHWSSELSNEMCARVAAMLEAARAFSRNSIVYDPVYRPNSNSPANFIGQNGGFFIDAPYNWFGWGFQL